MAMSPSGRGPLSRGDPLSFTSTSLTLAKSNSREFLLSHVRPCGGGASSLKLGSANSAVDKSGTEFQRSSLPVNVADLDKSLISLNLGSASLTCGE